MTPVPNEIREFLEEKVALYNRPHFIESDPVSIPHRYDRKEDIEVAGFLAAILSWGNRKMIVQNGKVYATFRMENLFSSPGGWWSDQIPWLSGTI